MAEDPTLIGIAERHGATAAQVATRWLSQKEGVVATPEAARPEHRAANLDVFGIQLTATEMERVGPLARPDGRLIDPPGLAPDRD